MNQFVIAKTVDALVVGDIISGKISEIPWRGSGNEKFDFTNSGVCMVYNAGELTLV